MKSEESNASTVRRTLQLFNGCKALPPSPSLRDYSGFPPVAPPPLLPESPLSPESSGSVGVSDVEPLLPLMALKSTIVSPVFSAFKVAT